MTTDNSMDRRDFMKTSAAATAAGAVALSTQPAAAAKKPGAGGLIHLNERPGMTYRKVGRSNLNASRLVFGCGAALSGGKAVHLLERTFEAGINYYDIGSDVYYRGSEKVFAPFAKAHRDDIWITSKAPIRGSFSSKPKEDVTVQEAKEGAKRWNELLDASLKDMQIDYVDAYFLMMVDVPAFMKSDEIYNGFLKAKQAGKVGHFGFSSHRRQQECLEAAIETGWYDLAMIAITPAGWYDFNARKPGSWSQTLKDLRPTLENARNAGIGLVAMKSGRYLAAKDVDPAVYDEHYDAKLLDSSLSAFQRSYAYVLENGMDVVNADMQNFRHFEENLKAAQVAHELV